MSGRHAPKPSPLGGEGAERRRREAGEGAFSLSNRLKEIIQDPSPRPRYARAPLSRKGRGDGARCPTGAQR